MKKIKLLTLLLFTSISLLAQDKNEDEPSFTSSHRSTTLFYGVSSLFGLGSYAKDGGGIGKGFTAGPVSLSFNKALTEQVSFHWGPSVMYYTYKYPKPAEGEGTVSHLFGGISLGVNYHFATTGKVDPYAGVSAGAGYFHLLEEGDTNGYGLDGSIPLLYGLKVGANVYNKSNRAWTFELGLDYLSYLKVGYTFVRSK
jgi:hypothetical protein